MHRIDGPGATAGNLFTAGDPGAGTPATTVTAEWLNSVQEELAKVITMAGVALDKTKLDQLWTALTAYFAAKAAADAHYGAAAPHAGHETPAGAQGRVDAHAGQAAPHAGHETPAGAQAKVNAHAVLTNNPHGVTPAQIGVMAHIAAQGAGAIGSFAFLALAPVGTPIVAGQNYTGGVLYYTGVGAMSSFVSVGSVGISGPISGTWKAMGNASAGVLDPGRYAATLFQRIS